MIVEIALVLAFLQPSDGLSMGLISPENNGDIPKAVTLAVEFANRDILKDSSINLSIIVNTYRHIIQHSCKLISGGIIAQIGPEDDSDINSIAYIFERLHVPLVLPSSSRAVTKYRYTIPVAPSDQNRPAAVASILDKMSWTTFHILSTEDEYHTSDLVRLMKIASVRGWNIVTSQVVSSNQSKLMSQLNLIKFSGCRVIIVNCVESEARILLTKATTQRLTGIGWIWIMTDLMNINSFFGEDRAQDHLNGLISIGLSPTTGTLAPAFDKEWSTRYSTIPLAGVSRWVDAVFVLAYAVRNHTGSNIIHDNLNCNSSVPWSMGSSVLSAINEVKQSGLFQPFDFIDKYPTKSRYNVYNSRNTGWVKIGTWDPDQGYQTVVGMSIELPGKLPASPGYIGSTNNQHFQIVTIAREPFFFYPKGSEPNDKMNVQAGIEIIVYSGLVIIGLISSHYRKSRFITPFHHHIWYAIVVTMFIFGAEIAFLEKLSPYGHHGEIMQNDWFSSTSVPNAIKKSSEQMREALAVMRFDNALWYSLATFIQQGCSTFPQAFSSRILSLFWFMSVGGIITMYTAQLGAISIKSHLQGSNQHGSSEQFLCESTVALYKNMCKKMTKWNSWAHPKDTVARLADPTDLWGFITDSPIVDSLVQKKPCNSRALGELFNKGGFGIGLQKNSHYTKFTERTECAQENEIQSDSEKNRKKLLDIEGVFYVIVAALIVSPLVLIIEFTYSCFQLKTDIANGNGNKQQPNGLWMIFKYRLSRILRDVKIYLVPDHAKRHLRLEEFEQQRQYQVTRDRNIAEHNL